jgi:hypothetical protein
MVIDFNTFTRYFFYLFVSYQCAKYNYPEKTKLCLIFIGYNAIYLYSKLQILVNKQIIEGHDTLIKYEEYRNLLNYLYKIKVNYDVLKECVLSYITREPRQIDKLNEVTLDFVLNNEVIFTFEKSEFVNDYLVDFFPNKKENNDNTNGINENESKRDDIIDYDFVIINCDENLKKIIKHVDLIKREFDTETCSSFKSEPFLFKPLLCEFSNQGDQNDDHDDRPIKIDFCDNNKLYDFLVIGNCFDKVFLTYFMKKYYDVDVKENYVLKIIDNNVNSLIIEGSDTLTIGENSLVVSYKKINNIYS